MKKQVLVLHCINTTKLFDHCCEKFHRPIKKAQLMTPINVCLIEKTALYQLFLAEF